MVQNNTNMLTWQHHLFRTYFVSILVLFCMNSFLESVCKLHLGAFLLVLKITLGNLCVFTESKCVITTSA